MSFDAIPGQTRVTEFLKQGIRQRRTAHAYCFAGPKGVGRYRTALELAKALNCVATGEDACDRCRNCIRIENGNHPDVWVVEPDGQSIKIDQVRGLQRAFHYTTSENATRVMIIQQAETMTVQAANSLLKFLEEPITPMVAVLITEHVHSLLPTVLSRCQVLRFAPLAADWIAQKLEVEGFNAAEARVAAHIAPGLDEAREIASMDGFALFCERMIQWSGEIVSGKSDALLSVQTKWIHKELDKDRLELVLDLMLLWLRDLLNQKLKRTVPPVFLKWEDSCRRQAPRWSMSRLIHGMETVIDARRQLAGPVQPQAVLEFMVLAMQGGATDVQSRRRSF
jgi:DNA polymerase III subunit delta'